MLIHEVTGNHATFYLGFLVEPDTWHWSGTPAALWPLFRSRAAGLVVPAAATLALAVAAEAAARRVVDTRLRAGVLAAVWLGLSAAGPVLMRLVPAPLTFVQLDETLPVSWNIGFVTGVSPLAEVQTRAATMYAAHFLPKRASEASPPPAPAAPRLRPNVILLVLDGLRADALTPVSMARVWRWSQRGSRDRSRSSLRPADRRGAHAARAPGVPRLVRELPASHGPLTPRAARVVPTLLALPAATQAPWAATGTTTGAGARIYKRRPRSRRRRSAAAHSSSARATRAWARHVHLASSGHAIQTGAQARKGEDMDMPRDDERGRVGYLVLYMLGVPVGLLILLWVLLGNNIFGPG